MRYYRCFVLYSTLMCNIRNGILSHLRHSFLDHCYLVFDSSPPRSARGSRRPLHACWRGLPLLILLLQLCIGNNTSLAAQSRFPLVVSCGTHSLTVPWYPGPVTNRLNPALIVGTERTLRPGNRIRLYHTANLGFFQHYWWMTGVFLDTELGASYALPLGLHADLRLGVGYLHYFWRRKVLELKDGAYVQVTDWGKPSLMIPLSVELGYRGSSTRPLAVSPFLSVQWAVQGLFLEEVPAMPHLFILVGARIPLDRIKPAGGR